MQFNFNCNCKYIIKLNWLEVALGGYTYTSSSISCAGGGTAGTPGPQQQQQQQQQQQRGPISMLQSFVGARTQLELA